MTTLLDTAGTVLTLTKGRDESYLVTVAREDLEIEVGELVGAVFCIKRDLNAPDDEALVRRTLNSGITVVTDDDASTVKFRVDIPRSASAELSALVRYAWDFALKDASGDLHPVESLFGTVEVCPRVAITAD